MENLALFLNLWSVSLLSAVIPHLKQRMPEN